MKILAPCKQRERKAQANMAANILKTCLFLLLFAFNLICCHEFEGPASSHISGYWPLDANSGLKNMITHEEISRPDAYLVTQLPGPSGLSGSSYSHRNTNGYSLISVTLQGHELESFTLAMYLRTQTSSRGGDCIELASMKQEKQVLKIKYCHQVEIVVDMILQLTTYTLARITHVTEPAQWSMIAVTYNIADKQLKVIDKTGVTIGSYVLSNSGVVASEPIEFEAAHIFSGDQASCVLLYHVALTAVDVTRIPCTCMTNGKCPITKSFDPPPYFKTPRMQSLTRFWPLMAGTSGFYDIRGTFIPKTIHAKFEHPTTYGQFPRSIQIFSAIGTDFTPMVEYEYVDELATRPFTLSFFLYARKKSSGGILSLSSTLTIEYSGNNVTVVDTYNQRFSTIALNYEEWNFVAITYDKKIKLLKWFNGFGVLIGQHTNVKIERRHSSHSHLDVGFQNMRNASVVCLLIFYTALEPNDVRLLPKSCTDIAPQPASSNCIPDYVGPGQDKLIGFWPLDGCWRLQNIWRKSEPETHATFVSLHPGPYNPGHGSHGSAEPNMAVYDLGPFESNDFTLSLFFLKDNAQDSIVLAIDNLLQVATGKLGKINVIKFNNQTVRSIGNHDWLFFCVRFNSTSETLTFHRRSGDLVTTFRNVEMTKAKGLTQGSLTIGNKLNDGDRISCVTLINRMLTEVEISMLACVCKENGFCPQNYPINTAKTGIFTGPEPYNLVAYLPMDEQQGIAESVYGMAQRHISQHAMFSAFDLFGFETPPFSTNKRSTYMSIGNSSLPSLVSFEMGSLPNDLTVSGFIKIRKENSIEMFKITTADDIEVISLNYRNLSFIIQPGDHQINNVTIRSDGWLFFTLTISTEGMIEVYDSTFQRVRDSKEIDFSEQWSQHQYSDHVIMSVGRFGIGERMLSFLLWDTKLPGHVIGWDVPLFLGADVTWFPMSTTVETTEAKPSSTNHIPEKEEVGGWTAIGGLTAQPLFHMFQQSTVPTLPSDYYVKTSSLFIFFSISVIFLFFRIQPMSMAFLRLMISTLIKRFPV